MHKTELFNRINDDLLSKIETGTLPWRREWSAAGVPYNMISKKAYQGINFLLLMFDRVPAPQYLTFLQAKEKNLLIKKGSKGRQIVFWKILDTGAVNTKTSEIETKHVPFLRFSYVFNVSDLEGYHIPAPSLKMPLDVLNGIVQAHNPVITNNLERCYYSASDNLISTPTVNNFTNEQEYFSAIFHELVHWTGHQSRLNRSTIEIPGNHKSGYAYEELIAEIGSSYLCSMCGLETLNNSAAYLSGWMKTGKLDNSYFITATQEAFKAVNFLINQTPEEQAA